MLPRSATVARLRSSRNSMVAHLNRKLTPGENNSIASLAIVADDCRASQGAGPQASEVPQMSRLKWTSLLLIGTLVSLSCFSQNSGAIQGVLLDPQGAAIPSAKISALDEDKNVVVRQTTSGTDGRFQLRPLLPGRYAVR